MKLHETSFLNRTAKRLSPALSRVICSGANLKYSRMLDAYLNFLMGKGSGTGWDLDSEIRAAAKYLVNPNPVVFDVGANVGEWSERLIQTKPQATVLMFEPSPHCQKRISERSIPGARLIPCALGSEEGTARLNFSSETDGSASLHQRKDSYFQERTYQSVEVPVRTIDAIVSEMGIGRIDFMKMDIEGHEFQALQGARETLAAGKIGAMTFEFGSGNINSRTYFRDFWELLSAHGFRIFRMAPGDSMIPIPSYYEDLEYFRGVSNYLAVRDSREA